jgi:hypothetical protein
VADGAEFPTWLTQLGAAIAPALAVLGFVVNRADRINARIDKNNDAAMAGIEAAKIEASEALTAAIDRFDSRHEAIRREISMQIGSLLERINSMNDTMARREDLTAIASRIDAMNARMDRVLDTKP